MSGGARISLDEVRHVARLARIALSEDEVVRLQRELDPVLDYVAALSAVDVDGVPPTMHVQDMPAELRADAVEPMLDRDVALAQAPSPEDGAFAVPKVLEVGG
ncbi:MAG: Asp-tRNA(Asn)/Glu-tRNA(Gln) amidotransferase subunit GatC [Myxococcales bacterium]|nr:Asp-tRNA(Asn)/Glu-tRNA(Gln) amidotransferase subunit GatC [Myxococcales bacterium]